MKIGSFLHKSLNNFHVLRGPGASHCMDACYQTAILLNTSTCITRARLQLGWGGEGVEEH